jgi:IS1 family transposase
MKSGVQLIRCLVEGNSVRATVRITGASKNAIQRLTKEIGEACLKFQDKMLRNLNCQRIQCDEQWCFCYAKDRNLPDSMRGMPGVGSMWTWVALDADSKLIVSWRIGARDVANAHAFIRDVKERLANRVQLTTDSARVYLNAVKDYFGDKDIDYAMLKKLYGEGGTYPEMRYSPAKCLGTRKQKVLGNPDPDHVSTSYVERQNLNVRMQNRRYTILTNAFSKKADMLAYSIAITFAYHNFVRVHQTLKATPAVAAGTVPRPWKISDLVELADVPQFAGK